MSGGVWQMPTCIKEHVKVHSSGSSGSDDHDIACSSHCLHFMYSDVLRYTLRMTQTRRDGSFNSSTLPHRSTMPSEGPSTTRKNVIPPCLFQLESYDLTKLSSSFSHSILLLLS
jgi:hypothetical protein